MIPTYVHPGGDWWISAMRELWHFVAHLAARDAAEGVSRPRPDGPRWESTYPRRFATGGNEPKIVASSWARRDVTPSR